ETGDEVGDETGDEAEEETGEEVGDETGDETGEEAAEDEEANSDPTKTDVPITNPVIAAITTDINSLDYGELKIGTEKWIGINASSETAVQPTVRNTGNVPVYITIRQCNMGIDDDLIIYGARLGENGETVYFSPNERVILPEILEVNATSTILFSITVSGGEGPVQGSLWIDCIPVEEEEAEEEENTEEGSDTEDQTGNETEEEPGDQTDDETGNEAGNESGSPGDETGDDVADEGIAVEET
ncbi:hypothetical protein, partial [Methanocalculus chunghsingensis]|uniref:hypothetical protein n=1 Tax=Methanocalculus chunghsingensis TaxID=156457 RepID=UPI001B8D8736